MIALFGTLFIRLFASGVVLLNLVLLSPTAGQAVSTKGQDGFQRWEPALFLVGDEAQLHTQL
jgi:hypothetical protein